MSTGKPRDHQKERFWRTMLQRWRQSGLSVRHFCVQHGLAQPSFYAWRRTLAQRDALQFVPVRVAADAPPAATTEPTALELLLDGPRRLRIGPGFDGPTLQRLLALLAEDRP